MDRDALVTTVARIRAAWDAHVVPSRRRASLALVFLVFLAGAELARLGSPSARVAAAVGFLLTVGLLGLRALLARRKLRDPRAVTREIVAPIDRELAAATLRALTLVERSAADPNVGSASLASLHLTRLFGRVSPDRLDDGAARVALRWSTAGLALAAGATAIVALEPFRIVEGLDILAARRSEAPVPLRWVDDVAMTATPPEYLRQPSTDPRPFWPMKQPRGTVVTVRGRAIRPDRSLVITDGTSSVPFVDDGTGHIVARWTLAGSTSLWIAAEFGHLEPGGAGGVRIRQIDEQAVTSIPDEAPRVKVEDAPRTVRLIEEPSIPIHYEATDDHGLREVDLVLRAGSREVRRVLAHPGADVLVDRGGYEVLATDAFFKKTYVPVEITVEARDNDAVSGPKWGKSAAIVVIPPQVGEPEALRYQALLKARDALTDLTARRLTDKGVATGTPGAEHLKQEREAQTAALRIVNETLAGTYGGLSVRGRVVAVARGQIRRLTRALDDEKKTPSATTHQKLLTETEDVLLAFDSGVRGLGYRDAQSVAKRLADVADDVAAGLAPPPSADTGKAEGSADARVDAGVVVLDGGGKQLLRLGDLGVDLGEIVANDLRRIARARAAHDLPHAELAARDLAARLRKPDPSFNGGGGHGGGNGGKSGQGGVESGASGGADTGEPSEADEQAAQDERDLEDLAREHASKIGEVEDALEKAVSDEDLDRLKREAKEHADKIREAVKDLPAPRGRPSSSEASAAEAREDGEAMAGALEGGRPRDAVDNGKHALEKLREAERGGEVGLPEGLSDRIAQQTKPTLERELAWAEEALEKLRRASAARAKGDLQRLAKEEKRIAEKARDLGKRGESGDHAMPGDMLERLGEAEQAMRDAEKSLQSGESDGSLKHQRDAQRLLEMARGEREEGQNEGARREGDGHDPKDKADVPGKDKHKGPEEFRKRVMDGLGGSSDPLLRDAVKRYAEGLLK